MSASIGLLLDLSHQLSISPATPKVIQSAILELKQQIKLGIYTLFMPHTNLPPQAKFHSVIVVLTIMFFQWENCDELGAAERLPSLQNWRELTFQGTLSAN